MSITWQIAQFHVLFFAANFLLIKISLWQEVRPVCQRGLLQNPRDKEWNCTWKSHQYLPQVVEPSRHRCDSCDAPHSSSKGHHQSRQQTSHSQSFHIHDPSTHGQTQHIGDQSQVTDESNSVIRPFKQVLSWICNGAPGVADFTLHRTEQGKDNENVPSPFVSDYWFRSCRCEQVFITILWFIVFICIHTPVNVQYLIHDVLHGRVFIAALMLCVCSHWPDIHFRGVILDWNTSVLHRYFYGHETLPVLLIFLNYKLTLK